MPKPPSLPPFVGAEESQRTFSLNFSVRMPI